MIIHDATNVTSPAPRAKSGLAVIAGGNAEATRDRYQSVLQKHVRFCREVGVDDWIQVTASHIMAYGEKLSKPWAPRTRPWAPRTISYELELVKSVHKFLITSKRLPESLRIHLPLRRPSGSDAYCYTPEQVRRMLQHCKQDARLRWLHRILLMLALTGFRISELVALRRSDIQYDDDGIPMFLRVVDEGSRALGDESSRRRRTKGRRSRQVPVHPRLQSLLASLPVRPDGVLFLDDRDRPIAYDVVRLGFINKVIHPLASEFPTSAGQIGFDRGRLHNFRHFLFRRVCSMASEEGEVRDWIGHADTTLIDLYRHLAADESRRRMQNLNLLGEQSGTERPSRVSSGPIRSASKWGRKSTGRRPMDEL